MSCFEEKPFYEKNNHYLFVYTDSEGIELFSIKNEYGKEILQTFNPTEIVRFFFPQIFNSNEQKSNCLTI